MFFLLEKVIRDDFLLSTNKNVELWDIKKINQERKT